MDAIRVMETDDLAQRVRAVASDGSRLRALVELAQSSGFEFDD